MSHSIKPNNRNNLVLALVIIFFTAAVLPLVPDAAAVNMLVLYTLSVLSAVFCILQGRTFVVLADDRVTVRRNCLSPLVTFRLEEIEDLQVSDKRILIQSKQGHSGLDLPEFAKHDREAINQYFENIQLQKQQKLAA